ncbi:MAG: deoxyguanosinetriphosphate triphosphohydrolase [Gammaproteobacteria bacterium]
MSKLACYAASEESSRGRVFEEPPPSMRTQFQRDRDRIIHSSAFRRLEYKTQVFVNHEGDMFRTRLTHSIEVSQIGRTIARSLSLNEDLTEAICLAHDLGHTPFGHAGQDALNRCMREYGGFEHNLQSLRVVDVLEEKYADFPGLNLMFETREGIIKHCSRQNAESLGQLGERFLKGTQPGLEAQIANVADEIAYNNHDVDDGLRAGLITIEQLNKCALFRHQHEYAISKWPGLSDRRKRHELIRRMINQLVTDLVKTSQEKINTYHPGNIEDVRNAGEALIVLSDEMREKHLELKQFLRKNLYNHDHVQRMADKAKQVIATLFKVFIQNQDQLPSDVKKKIADNHTQSQEHMKIRIMADYIAGMTDRFAMAEFDRITASNTNQSNVPV